MINSFGVEIRWDFQEILHVDLDDFFLGHRHWKTFEEFFKGLPRGSRTISAIADDDDVAEVLINEIESGKPPALEGWDGRDDALANIQDLLKSLLGSLTGADLPPTRRPVTAIERLECRWREQKETNLLDQLLPDR